MRSSDKPEVKSSRFQPIGVDDLVHEWILIILGILATIMGIVFVVSHSVRKYKANATAT